MSLASPRTVDDLLNYRLNRLLAASGAMVVRLCEGRYGISRREWRLIAMLAAHGSLSPSKLAEHCHLERPRVSRYLSGLVRRGLLERAPIAGDGRRARVSLTLAGQHLYQQLFPEAIHFHRQVLSVLEPDEKQLFDSLLGRLTDNAERIAASRPVTEKADRRNGGSRRWQSEAFPRTPSDPMTAPRP